MQRMPTFQQTGLAAGEESTDPLQPSPESDLRWSYATVSIQYKPDLPGSFRNPGHRGALN